MHKLKLHLDDLLVESFDTTTVRKEKGTVFGEQCSCYHTQCNTCPGCPTCPGYATCDGTCPNTCDDATCGGSCGGTCVASCDGGNTCEYCTMGYDPTCNNVGTCDPNAWGGCMITP